MDTLARTYSGAQRESYPNKNYIDIVWEVWYKTIIFIGKRCQDSVPLQYFLRLALMLGCCSSGPVLLDPSGVAPKNKKPVKYSKTHDFGTKFFDIEKNTNSENGSTDVQCCDFAQ